MKLSTRETLIKLIVKFLEDIKSKNISDKKLNQILKVLLMANNIITDELEIIELEENKKRRNKNMDDKMINDRLNKHFEMPMVESKKQKASDREFEVNKYYEHNLLQALNNSTIADQSDINRIKSLKNSGATLTESIKTVIPKKKHSLIADLVEIQRDKYSEFVAVQNRLK